MALAVTLAKLIFYPQSITVRGGQAMAETPILSWSATYVLQHLGLRGVRQLAIAPHSQLRGVFLDPPGSMGLQSGRGAGSMSLPSPLLRKRN